MAAPAFLAWIPNALTLSRLALGPVAGVGVAAQAWLAQRASDPFLDVDARREALFAAQTWWWVGALAFAAAAISDFLDGWLARRLKAESAFGAALDPIADKILVACVLLAIAVGAAQEQHGWVLWAPAAVILLRDVGVTALRMRAGFGGALTVSRLAQWKTALEFAAITLVFLSTYGAMGGQRAMLAPEYRGLGDDIAALPLFAGAGFVAALWTAAILSAVTGWGYWRRLRAAATSADS